MALMNTIPDYLSESKKIEFGKLIRSYELYPTVAYVVTMQSLRNLLEKGYLYNNPSTVPLGLSDNGRTTASSTPLALSAAPERISKQLEGHMQNIRDKFQDIQKIITQLKEKGSFFLNLLSKDKTHHIVGDEWREFEDTFVFATKRIMDAIKLIRESVKKLRSILSKNATYPALDQIEKQCKDLIDKIPNPSSKWDAKNAQYEGSKWLHKSINGEEKTVFYEWKRWFKDIKNPVGLLEMLLDNDKSKQDSYLKTLGNGLDSVEELFVNVGKYSRMLERESVFKHFRSLGTQEAYMYIVTTLLPMLEQESTATLEEQGKTMELIAGIYDKWNSIQKLINDSLKQPDKGAAAADDLGNKIKNITLDIQYQLKRARLYLPASAHTLLDTMKSLSDKLVTEYPKDFFTVAGDSDQTLFKTYMDNLAQGITALTSISNMTQQQLQIDTQYYNSLLGFQKSAQDSLNKTIQAALNNMRAV